MHTFVAAPTYDGWRCNAKALFSLAKQSSEVDFHESQASVTTLNCNSLWCAALDNRDAGITHFLMIHADVQPLNPKWFLEMHAIMAAHSADVLSVVIPMKTFKNQVSTGVETDDPWLPRKLTRLEANNRPETWTEAGLLLNTGLMLVDLRKPWVEQAYFHQHDGTYKNERGRWISRAVSEDWAFTRQARDLGAAIFATRKIKVAHRGEHDFQ